MALNLWTPALKINDRQNKNYINFWITGPPFISVKGNSIGKKYFTVVIGGPFLSLVPKRTRAECAGKVNFATNCLEIVYKHGSSFRKKHQQEFLNNQMTEAGIQKKNLKIKRWTNFELIYTLRRMCRLVAAGRIPLSFVTNSCFR